MVGKLYFLISRGLGTLNKSAILASYV